MTQNSEQLDALEKTEFRIITPPESYYTRSHVLQALEMSSLEIQEIEKRKILIDSEELENRRILLQAFTTPILSNGVFFELIQRWNGSGNFSHSTHHKILRLPNKNN